MSELQEITALTDQERTEQTIRTIVAAEGDLKLAAERMETSPAILAEFVVEHQEEINKLTAQLMTYEAMNSLRDRMSDMSNAELMKLLEVLKEQQITTAIQNNNVVNFSMDEALMKLARRMNVYE